MTALTNHLMSDKLFSGPGLNLTPSVYFLWKILYLHMAKERCAFLWKVINHCVLDGATRGSGLSWCTSVRELLPRWCMESVDESSATEQVFPWFSLTQHIVLLHSYSGLLKWDQSGVPNLLFLYLALKKSSL